MLSLNIVKEYKTRDTIKQEESARGEELNFFGFWRHYVIY